jgi:hypothetical protein
MKRTKRKVGQISTTSVELLPELKHAEQLALESTGIFLDSHKNWTLLYSPNKGSPKVIKIMKIVRKVAIKINHHPKCPFGVHQIFPRN